MTLQTAAASSLSQTESNTKNGYDSLEQKIDIINLKCRKGLLNLILIKIYNSKRKK